MKDKRMGYRSFIGMIWMLFKINKLNKELGFKQDLTIRLPINWI